MASLRTLTAPALRTAFRPQTYRLANAYSPNRYFSASAAAMAARVSDAIVKDHRELEQYYNEVINNTGNLDHQQRYGNQFTWELARHSVGEELVVYPAFEKYLGADGKTMAEHDRKEHHKVNTIVSTQLG
jgi:hypothetical protein